VAADDNERVRLALNQKDAAAALGLSVNTFKAHVRSELPRVYIGDAVRYPVTGLQAWLDKNAVMLEPSSRRH
jgi:hypothetical protein